LTGAIRSETLFADPDPCEFTASRTVHPGGSSFFDSQERAAVSPLVERLFAFDGVAHVPVADNVVAVGNQPSTSCSEPKLAIGAAIWAQLLMGTPGILASARLWPGPQSISAAP
jgi:hypothetical protein